MTLPEQKMRFRRAHFSTNQKSGNKLCQKAVFLVFSLVVERRMKKKLILDVDTGVDDAQAIMMALAAPNVEILGITCSHGNTKLDNACRNTLRVLKACNRLDVRKAMCNRRMM